MRKWRNQPLVRERDKRRVRRLWGMLIGIVAAMAPIGVYLFQQNECLELSYAVDALREEQERLLEQQRSLKVQRGALTSLVRIESWADRHGLVRPTPEQVMVVRHATAGSGSLMARAPDRRKRSE